MRPTSASGGGQRKREWLEMTVKAVFHCVVAQQPDDQAPANLEHPIQGHAG